MLRRRTLRAVRGGGTGLSALAVALVAGLAGLAGCAGEPADPCQGVTCSDHGTCAVSGGNAVCVCDSGYHAEGLDCLADAHVPSVSLSADPTSVDSGGSSRLTWSSADVTSCTASGAWSGARATAGSEVVGPLVATSSYTLTCSGPYGSAARTVTVYLMGDGLLLFDDFEYDVPRDSAEASALFAANGPWDGAKTRPSEPGANGYIYTADTVPGFAGVFPGQASSRVLCLEARPDLLQNQTDFYLQYGNGSQPIGHLPPNHWFQFWVYAAHAGDQLGLYSQGKFIYPNRADYYPATIANGGYIYMVSLNKTSAPPLSADPCPGGRDVGCPSFFLQTGWNTESGLTNNIPYEEGNFGANLADDIHLPPNQWTLVKIHVDISGADPRAVPGQAVYEMWIRRQGDPAWTKTTEYIGGVTESNGSPINFTPAYNDGFRMFRMPTTFGATSSAPGDWFDSWTYLDDFALAAAEEALPTYP